MKSDHPLAIRQAAEANRCIRCSARLPGTHYGECPERFALNVRDAQPAVAEFPKPR